MIIEELSELARVGELNIDYELHEQLFRIINREMQLNRSSLTEEPKTFNGKSLILVI